MALSVNTKKKNSLSVNILLGIIVLAGLFAWSRELSGAVGATHLNEYTPWGLYIAFFLFFEAMSAGILFVTSIGVITGSAMPKVKMAVMGIVAGVCAGLAILPDVGSPLVAWRLFFTPNVKAPMILDVWFLGLTVVVGAIVTWALISKKENVAKGWAYVLAVVSVLLPIGTSWMFTSLPGKLGWGSSLEIAVFLVQAAVMGTSIWYMLSKSNQAKITLGVALIANLGLTLGEVGHALYNFGIESLPTQAVMTGSYAPIFWLQILVGIVLPIILLWRNNTVTAVGVLSILGALVSKYVYVAKGNIFPFLYSGEGMQVPSLVGEFKGYPMTSAYFPSWEEWLVMCGVIAVGALLMNRILPKVEEKNE